MISGSEVYLVISKLFVIMSKRIYDLSNPVDIEELNRLAFEDEAEPGEIPEDDIEESDDSGGEDHVDVRSVDSETDHEMSDEESEGEEQTQNDYFGKWKFIFINV